MRKILSVLITICVLSITFSFCTKKEDTLARIKKEGKVVIGIANEIPYGYKDIDGAIKGEAPDVAHHILTKMGVKEIETVVTEFGSLIPGLKAGRFDVIAAGMYIMPKRCGQILFSEPTYSIGESFLVKSGNSHNLKSYEDVKKNPNIRLGVMAGAVEQGYARDMGIPDEQIVVFPDNFSGLSGVQSGRIEAFAGTSMTVKKLADQGEGVEMVKDFTDPEIKGKTVRGYGAFGFRQSDVPLRDEFNRRLEDYIGSPEHLKMIESYGFSEINLPGDKSTESLCSGE